MTDEERAMVQGVVECEGFDYAFYGYTDFEEHSTVNDKTFHKLKDAYLAAREKLHDYIYPDEE